MVSKADGSFSKEDEEALTSNTRRVTRGTLQRLSSLVETSPTKKSPKQNKENTSPPAAAAAARRSGRNNKARDESPPYKPARGNGSKGARAPAKSRRKKQVQRERIVTIISVNRMPIVYEEILKRLPADKKDQVDIFELQGLTVATCIDEDVVNDTTNEEEVEEKVIEHIVNVLREDESYTESSTRKRIMDSKLLTEKQADEEALKRYDAYIKSPENQKLLSYRTDSAMRHKWTEEDIKRFFEAFKKYGNGPTSNKQIAKYIGANVHPNHVSHYKALMRRKKKAEEKAKKQKSKGSNSSDQSDGFQSPDSFKSPDNALPAEEQ